MLPDAVQANDVVRADTVVLDVRDVEDKSKDFSWVGSKLLAVQNEEGFNRLTEVIEAVDETYTTQD